MTSAAETMKETVAFVRLRDHGCRHQLSRPPLPLLAALLAGGGTVLRSGAEGNEGGPNHIPTPLRPPPTSQRPSLGSPAAPAVTDAFSQKRDTDSARGDLSRNDTRKVAEPTWEGGPRTVIKWRMSRRPPPRNGNGNGTLYSETLSGLRDTRDARAAIP